MLFPALPVPAFSEDGARFQLSRYFSGNTSDWEIWGGNTNLVLTATELDAAPLAKDIESGTHNYRWFLSFNGLEEQQMAPGSCALHSDRAITLRIPTFTYGFSPSYNPGGNEDNGIYYDLEMRIENADGVTIYHSSVSGLHSTITDPLLPDVVTLDGSWKEPGFTNVMPSGKKSCSLLFTIKDPLAPTLYKERAKYSWRIIYESASGRWEQILAPSAFDGNTLFYFESCLGSPAFFPQKDERYFVTLELWQGGNLCYFAGGTIYGYLMQEDAVFDDTSYSITFVVDGKETITSVYSDALPAYPLGTPFKEHPDPTKYYSFTGWSPALAPATQNARYEAIFKEEKQSYNIGFSIGQKKWDASFESGAFPLYPFTFEEFDGQSYTLFKGFDKPLTGASENKIYTAILEEGVKKEDFSLLTLSKGITVKDGFVDIYLCANDPISSFEGMIVYDRTRFSLEKVYFQDGFEGTWNENTLSFSSNEGQKTGATTTLRFRSLDEKGACAIDLLPLKATPAVAVTGGYMQTLSALPLDLDQNRLLNNLDLTALLKALQQKEIPSIDCYPDGLCSIKDATLLCSYLSGTPTNLYLGTGNTLVSYESEAGGKIVGSVTQSIRPQSEGQAVYAREISAAYTFLGWSDGYGNEKRCDMGILENQSFTALYHNVVPALQVPQIRINTSGTPITSTETYISGTLTVSGAKEAYTLKNEAIEIRGRGNSSWDFERPSYKMKFEEKQHFLGIGAGAEKDWILLTTYSDKSLLRNYAMFRLGQLLDGVGYASDCTFVELYLNGNYRGIYLLCAQVEPSNVRLRLNDSPEKADKDYLLLLDARGAADSTPLTYFTIPNGQQPFVIKSTVNSAAERNYIRNQVHKLNIALLSGEKEKIEALCDMQSLVDNYILQEFSHNRDVGFASFYFYRQNGVFYFGPPWDFDLSMGNDRDYPNAVNELFSQNGRGNHWYDVLSKQPWFKTMVRKRLAEIEPQIETVIGEVEMMGIALKESANRQYSHFKVLGYPVFLEPSETAAFQSYDQHVAYLTNWMTERLKVLKKTFRVVG